RDGLPGERRRVERRLRPGALEAVDAVALRGVRDRAGDRLEAAAVVDLDVRVVTRVGAAVLDVPARPERQRRAAGRERDLAGQRELVLVALIGPPLLGPAVRRAELRGHGLVRQRHHDALRLGAVVLVRAKVERAGRARGHDLVVEPAELELVPRAEVRRAVPARRLAGAG